MPSAGSDNGKKIRISIALVVVILALCVYYFYTTVIKPQTSDHSSVVGYVTYVSPTDYNFLIISSSSSTSAVSGTLPSMAGFPSVDDQDYQYIGDAGFKGTLPNVGDKVSINVDVDNNIETNPPYTFSSTTTNINVLLDAQFNAYVKSLIQTAAGN
jgi:hypothetical protein